ncbi:MAG: LytTR family transcriptional regulator [Robiginitomaculum sp.]|nr:LytTR family transcriptional regulator [Robiginitomaculum sp.]
MINIFSNNAHTEIRADHKADTRTYMMVLLFVVASWIVLSSTEVTELASVDADRKLHIWLDQGSSHFVIAICMLMIPMALSKFPLVRKRIGASFTGHILACLVFSAVHILAMVGLRTALYPSLFGEVYHFGLLDPQAWIYEFRKDAYTYVLVLFIFQTGRQLNQLRLELLATHEEARTHQRIVLKSGGRTIFLSADEVIWAKAASNYVEVRTKHKTHLARMTLGRLDELLSEAGNAHVQTHRSYIVRRDAICEIVPTGEGDAKLALTNGENIPVSRNYRHLLHIES